MLLKNKKVVITGCNRGIGLEILKKFYNNGAEIFACVRSKNKEFLQIVKDLEKKQSNKIHIKEFNLEDEDLVKKTALNIIDEAKTIDVLINNAGEVFTSLFQMTSIKKFRTIFDVNFFNQISFTQIILKAILKNEKGNILFISSTSATDGTIGRSAYSSSKGAINSMVKVLARELGKNQIRVNAIAPGLIDTDMAKINTKENFKQDFINSSSLQRIGKPEEIANSAFQICLDDNSFMTGQIIRIDGGV
jgi:3-oxoacyl-[acyl-carrier protein] reductase